MSHAAIVGIAEYPAQKPNTPAAMTSLHMAADLAVRALEDAGLPLNCVDGLAVCGIHESQSFVPSTVAEYLGVTTRFCDAPDLGGATPAGMVAHAAAAVERGGADVVLCLVPGLIRATDRMSEELVRFGASSYRPGSPQAEFEIPFGHLGQNAMYAMIAQRYAHEHGYDERALARLVVHQRRNANRTPGAIFRDRTLTEDEVLASKLVARPLRMLEIVMPAVGGAAVVVASEAAARRARQKPVWITGHAERIAYKSPHYARDLLDPPLRQAAAEAFAMAGTTPTAMSMAQIYDCYSITVLLALEAAGFCARGEGMAFLREHDMTWNGDFPINTNGGQLGYGQTQLAGGMGHVVEAARQLMRRADDRQVARPERAFVMGNGGIMSEQVALVLQSD